MGKNGLFELKALGDEGDACVMQWSKNGSNSKLLRGPYRKRSLENK